MAEIEFIRPNRWQFSLLKPKLTAYQVFCVFPCFTSLKPQDDHRTADSCPQTYYGIFFLIVCRRKIDPPIPGKILRRFSVRANLDFATKTMCSNYRSQQNTIGRGVSLKAFSLIILQFQVGCVCPLLSVPQPGQLAWPWPSSLACQ